MWRKRRLVVHYFAFLFRARHSCHIPATRLNGIVADFPVAIIPEVALPHAFMAFARSSMLIHLNPDAPLVKVMAFLPGFGSMSRFGGIRDALTKSVYVD
jgi:hypothetical protein